MSKSKAPKARSKTAKAVNKQPRASTSSTSDKRSPAASKASNRSHPPTDTGTLVSRTLPLTSVAIRTHTDVEEELTSVGGNTYQSLVKSTHNKESLRMTIRSFVEREFFPNVKFINNMNKLAFYDMKANPKTYCAFITKGCGVPEGYDVAAWWESIAKPTVRRKIVQLRGDRICSLKWQYYGKYICCICVFVKLDIIYVI